MGTIDERGVYIYDRNDQISPFHTLLNLGQMATSNAIKLSKDELFQDYRLMKSVPDRAAANAWLQECVEAGFPPTAQSPIYVIQEDIGSIIRTDNTGWVARYTADDNMRTITGRSTITVDYNAWPAKPGPTRIRDSGDIHFGYAFTDTPFVEVTSAIFTTGHVVTATAVALERNKFQIRIAAPAGTPRETRTFTWSATGPV